MILLGKCENRQGESTERYRLNDLCSSDQSIPPGLMISYLLTICDHVVLCCFQMEGSSEGGDVKGTKKIDASGYKRVFSDIYDYVRNYDEESLKDLPDSKSFKLESEPQGDPASLIATEKPPARLSGLKIWNLDCIYRDIKIRISGTVETSDVSITYDRRESVNMIPLLAWVEDTSWKYHGMDQALLSRMEKEYHLSETAAVRALLKLRLHPDIYREFVDGLSTEIFCFPMNPIREEEYTARELVLHYPLSILGAYNYLIYLRTNPTQALEDLKNGLPR